MKKELLIALLLGAQGVAMAGSTSAPLTLNPIFEIQQRAAEAIQKKAGTLNAQISRLPTLMPVRPGAPISGRVALVQMKAQAALDQYANIYGMKRSEFENALNTDSSMWVDKDGFLLFADGLRAPKGLELKRPGVAEQTGGEATPAKYTNNSLLQSRSSSELVTTDPSQAFNLSSNPGSKKTVYLNFLGQTITNTAWNSLYNIQTIDLKPFDRDGDSTTFSNDERLEIIAIWRRLAQFYAPFDVNVTTMAPDPSAINRDSSADDSFGSVIHFGPDPFNGQCGCYGASYVGVFNSTSNSYRDVFILTDNANTLDLSSLSAIHEFGHNVGLSHDGVTGGTPYYGGYTDQSPEMNWAPIMGNATPSTPRNVIQFSKGDYPGANNTEDDYQVIQAHELSLDSTEPPTVPDGGNWTVQGILNDYNGHHSFALKAPKGYVQLDINRDQGSKNTAVEAFLYRNGVQLGVNDGLVDQNPDQLATRFVFESNGVDNFYLYIRPLAYAGNQSPGFPSYGSIGTYSVQSTFTAGPPPSVSISGPTSVLPLLTYTWSAVINSPVVPTKVQWKWSDQPTYVSGTSVSRSLGLASTTTLTMEAFIGAQKYTTSVVVKAL